MLSKTMRFEILLEAAPDAVVSVVRMDQRGVIRLVNRQSGRHGDRTGFSASISLSHIDTGDGLLDHGGA